MNSRHKKNNDFGGLRLAAIAVTVGTAWVLFEWLFFATKPSFMSLYSLAEKFSVLSNSALLVSASLLLLTLPLAAAGWLLSRLGSHRAVGFAAGSLAIILLLAMAMLMVIDNFTLTVFGWGVRNAAGTAILTYRVLTVLLLAAAAWLLYGFWSGRYSGAALRGMSWVAGLILLSSVPLLMTATGSRYEPQAVVGSDGHLPNILVLTGDGIAAEHLSVYGYERPTTPFLDRVKDEFLIAENHFTNASDTGGSIISLLTGKLPTTTRVVYPPDALRAQDSFQHLPGMLKTLGYYNADISMRHYADPYDLNLRNGFAEANFRQLKDSGGLLVATIREVASRFPTLNPASLLIDRMSERVSERYHHIWKNEPMMDPLAEVNRPDRRWIQDDERLAEILRLVDEAPRPFFIHVLTMGTHGERFKPSRRVYSTEDDYEVPWHVDGYDDAIMDFDRFVEAIYSYLQERDLLESTVLIISSDHGFIHSAQERVPMMMRLPGRERTGMIGGNTQRLDIAPTLLEVLGVSRPDWMEGESLLELDPSIARVRPIFASGSQGDKVVEGNFWSVSNPQPPWYSMGRISLIHCDQSFLLWLASMKMEAGTVPGSTAGCADRLTPEQARVILLGHLKEKGYVTP